MRLGGLENALHILNGIIFLEAFVEHSPRAAFFAQDLVLRIGENNCSVLALKFHSYLTLAFFRGLQPGCQDRLGIPAEWSIRQFAFLEKFFDPVPDFFSVCFQREVSGVQ